MMNLISHNNKYVLFSDKSKTILMDNNTFSIAAELDLPTTLGHLQYGTGIAALVNSSKVRIYDFLFQKDIYELQSFLKICKVSIFKNLLIIVSMERILIHDLKTKANKCYIPIQQGHLAFVSEDYYALKISYFTETHLITSREFWLNKTTHIEGVTFNMAAYSPKATTTALALKNVLSIYQDKKLLTLYGFDSNVEQIIALGDYFFVRLENQTVIGCNEEQQVHFLEHQTIEIDFWRHEYQTVLFGGKDVLYQMAKGIVKKYRLDRAIPCKLSDSKNMVKKNSSKEL